MDHFNETVNGTLETIAAKVGVASWALTIELVYLIIVQICGIPGNIVIITVQLNNANKSSTDYYVLTMAIFELLCSCVNAPIKTFKNTGTIWRLIVSNLLCKVRASIVYVTVVSTTMLLAMIAIDRYVKTCMPLSTFYTRKRSRRICISITIIGVLFGIAALFTHTIEDDMYTCGLVAAVEDLKRIIDMLVALMQIAVFLIICFSYFNIALALHQRHRRKLKIRMQSYSKTAGDLAPKKGRFRRTNAVENNSSVSQPNKVRTSGDIFCTTDEDCLSTNTTDQKGKTCHFSTASDNIVPNVNCDVSNSPQAIATVSGHANAVQGPSMMSAEKRMASSMIQRSSNGGVFERQIAHAEQSLNRTTRIMFAITLVYGIIGITTWVIILTNDSLLGPSLYHLSRTLPYINCISNPIMFFAMSSNFRSNARKFFCRI